MKKNLTCIECPAGCALSVDIENRRVVKVSGHTCPKGEGYAIAEIENPVRILTSTVLAEGVSLKMVPVRTGRPIPKRVLFDAMREIKKLKISGPIHVGDVIVENFLGLGVDLIATRDGVRE